jgi:hypothetical protein
MHAKTPATAAMMVARKFGIVVQCGSASLPSRAICAGRICLIVSPFLAASRISSRSSETGASEIHPKTAASSSRWSRSRSFGDCLIRTCERRPTKQSSGLEDLAT